MSSGKPHIRPAREPKTCRHHADDGPRCVAHANRSLEDAGVASKTVLPVCVADEHLRGCSRSNFCGGERATDDRINRKDTEELRIDARRASAFAVAPVVTELSPGR